MTSSPLAIDMAARLPSSRSLPGPTATTLPRCGFCLAVSGSKIPPAVFSSASRGSTTTRSSSGRTLTSTSFSFAIGEVPFKSCQLLESRDRKGAVLLPRSLTVAALRQLFATSCPCRPCHPCHPCLPYHPCRPCHGRHGVRPDLPFSFPECPRPAIRWLRGGRPRSHHSARRCESP